MLERAQAGPKTLIAFRLGSFSAPVNLTGWPAECELDIVDETVGERLELYIDVGGRGADHLEAATVDARLAGRVALEGVEQLGERRVWAGRPPDRQRVRLVAPSAAVLKQFGAASHARSTPCALRDEGRVRSRSPRSGGGVPVFLAVPAYSAMSLTPLSKASVGAAAAAKTTE